MDNSLKHVDQKAKSAFIASVLKKLESNLDEIVRSADAAHGGATHEDAVAKSKYDTHGLELSYLAGSQYERANLLQGEIKSLMESSQKVLDSDAAIGHSSIIEIEDEDSGKSKLLFLSPFGAGLDHQWNGKKVTIVSPQSPLGNELMDQYLGDGISLSSNDYIIIGLV